MKIQFYVPSDEVIPTRLRLKIDDKYDVYYKRDDDEFAYRFTFWNNAVEVYKEILDEIVSRMIWQSEDHGARWCETGRCIIHDPGHDSWDPLIVKVSFRIRDAG